MARFVGRRHPPLASDLLSAVELAVAGPALPPGASPAITRAFHGAVARRCRRSTCAGWCRSGRLRAAGALGAACWSCCRRLAAPAPWAGLALLIRQPTRFEGAVVSNEPLIGDVRLTYIYPAYTGLPPRVVEGSTGDVVALQGTQVTLETKLLRSARQALLLLGDRAKPASCR